jgi:hypothetical protein
MADLVILKSGQVPPTAINGQQWLQADTGQLWAYLNDKWSPITGGRGFDIINPLSIFIGGLNRTCATKLGSLKINNQITSKVDTCSFTLYNDGDSVIRPEVGEQIDIFEYGTSTKIYSGEISKIKQSQESLLNNYFSFSISSTDYTKRLSKRLVTKEYTNEFAGDIIKDIIDTYYTEFSYINVQEGPKIDYVAFNLVTGLNAIKKIAKLSGYDWYVDPTKDIHFFLPATNYAPYELYDDNDTKIESDHYFNLKINRDKANYRNKIYLQGGYYTEAFNDDIQVADGEQTTFNLAYEPYSPVAVYVDTGSGYVQKTLGVDNIDTSGYDFVVNQTEKCVRNLDLATLNAGNKIKVTYNKRIKIIVEDENTTSQSDIQSREGGDGIYEYKLNDDTIASIASANERIDAEIADYKDPQVSGSFITDQPGYQAGQIIKTYLKTWGYDYDDNEFKIQTVTITPKTPKGEDERSFVEYKIVFRSFERSFEQFLLNMYDNSTNKEIVVKGDEKLIT